jgi:hypothetical protein
MKKVIKKLIVGVLSGTIGIDFKKVFDNDGDGKISKDEWFDLSNWVRVATSLGTSILGLLFFL